MQVLLQISRYTPSSYQNRLLLYLRGRNQGEWNQNKWLFNFFTVYNQKIQKITKNGVLLGLTSNKFGDDSYYLRIESGKKHEKGL